MGLTWKLIGGATVGGVAIFAGTGALSDNTTRNPGGEITDSGGLGAYVVRVGDCLQLPSGEDEFLVASFEGVPCETPHDAQVFAKFALSDAAFPGSAQIQTLAADGCLRYWPGAVGTVYETDNQHDLLSLYPTQESWADDDREVACLVGSMNGALLTGSNIR